jgi:acetylornithine deacetylase/succinyl-diaminopimelate desuccinylase-like protein
MAELSGNTMFEKYNVHDGVKCMSENGIDQMYLNNTWRANMAITGAAGLPPIQGAGNVCRPSTSMRLSIRLPPKVNPDDAYKTVMDLMTTDVPYNAKVTCTPQGKGCGWCMGELSPWLLEGVMEAGQAFWNGKKAGSYGMGGSIPFLAELEKMYPKTQIIAFGLIGPGTNAHAPDECINLAFAKKLTCALSHVMATVGQN